MTDEESEQIPSREINPRDLSDEELERELTITVSETDPAHLAYYERLLREKAERRARRGKT
jgi:hypothetical protein